MTHPQRTGPGSDCGPVGVYGRSTVTNWDALGDIFGGLGRAVERSLTSLFGSSNARYIRKMQPMVDAIGALEPKYQAMTDAESKEQTPRFRKRLAGGETLDDLLVEAFAVCREAGRATWACGTTTSS